MQITGTFKLRKIDLVKDGFDPAKISDPLYMYDTGSSIYVPLTAARYADIVAGRVKF
jgi:fatty-acyl-CoA synthase